VYLAVDDLAATHASAVIKPGTKHTDPTTGKVYRFVKNQATDAATQYYPCVYMDADPHDNEWEVTADISDGLDEGAFAGVAEKVEIPAGEYGWLLVEGVCESCNITDAATVAIAVILDTVDGYFEAIVDTELLAPAGVAFETTTVAVTDNSLAIFIKAL